MNRIFSIIMLVVLGVLIVNALPFEYGQPGVRDSDYYLKHGREETGALNMITAIYLNYRAYDTLGEATVFFASALGVFMLLIERGKESG